MDGCAIGPTSGTVTKALRRDRTNFSQYFLAQRRKFFELYDMSRSSSCLLRHRKNSGRIFELRSGHPLEMSDQKTAHPKNIGGLDQYYLYWSLSKDDIGLYNITGEPEEPGKQAISITVVAAPSTSKSTAGWDAVIPRLISG